MLTVTGTYRCVILRSTTGTYRCVVVRSKHGGADLEESFDALSVVRLATEQKPFVDECVPRLVVDYTDITLHIDIIDQRADI